ncbi:MAG: FAD-binding oxidoreductase [Pseudomonadota bacterium]
MKLFSSSIHTREHAGSYYAATQRDIEGYPTLSENIRVDVCIVGGGFSGVATALELAESGYKVALLEAQLIGWGASGRNGGQIIGGFGEALARKNKDVERKLGIGATQTLRAMGVECVDIIRERVAKYQIECDLKWGYIDVARKAREEVDLKAWQEELRRNNYPHETRWVEKKDIKSIVGSDRYISGLVNMGYGHVQVLDLCKGESRAAESLGARIYERTMVKQIRRGDPCVVVTDTGTVTANFVVLCGNAYLRQLAPELAPEINPYIMPASSYIIATEPLTDELANSVMAEDYAVCDQRTALDYFRLSADKRLLFGGMSNYTARDPKSITSTMSVGMHKVFPQLKNTSVEYEWGGHMGIGLNRVPQFGRVTSNIYFVQAYSGHGVAPTHLSGRILSEVIQNQAERFDLMAKVKHVPLPGGQKLGQTLMAAGMMFYKIRDEL